MVEQREVPGAVVRLSLLAVTVLGTMSNNIVNVPLRNIAADFHQPVAAAVLCVSAFVLTLAVAMPLTGWLGDRIGPKRTVAGALALMGLAQFAAAVAPTLHVLVATRAFQGLGCSAIPPIVMGMLARFYPDQRMRMMGAWAAANGVGQAVGPPLGGIISQAWGWRTIFVIMGLASAAVLAVILKKVPVVAPSGAPLHVTGAALLTAGVGLVLVAATAVSQAGIPYWADATLVVVGLVLLVGFGAVSRGHPRPMVPVRLIIEARFARSSVAAFAQMFTLGTVLVAMPLFLTGPMGLSESRAGILFFALPLAMAVMAPLVSRLSDRTSPRLILRLGLVVVVVGTLLTGWLTDVSTGPGIIVWITVLLVVLGVGMSMVQSPAAAGATRSPAGAYGAALGMFSMFRFSGTTAGAAWVALMFPQGHPLVLFLGCALVALVGLALSYAGPNPPATADRMARPVSRSPGRG